MALHRQLPHEPHGKGILSQASTQETTTAKGALDGPSQKSTAPSCCGGRGLAFKMAALAVVLSALGGLGLARWLRPPEKQPPAPPAKFSDNLFLNWPKPDLAIVLSAQQHGYLLPCGCSRPQVGGLERRYNFIQMLRKRGWPVVAADLGDIAQKRSVKHLPNLQGLVKYRHSMYALKEMDYTAASFGEYEAGLTLFRTLGEYALNEKKPRVLAANLENADTLFPEQVYPIAFDRPDGSDIRVGFTAVVGRTVATKIREPQVAFGSRARALRNALKRMDDVGVNLPVLLYQGRVTSNRMKRPPTEAIACAEAFPQFPLILALCDEDEPPASPVEVTNPKSKEKSWIVTVGHKGKYVGVVGVFKTGRRDRPFTFRYQLAEMTESFLTPADERKDHPILKRLEEYTKELKRDNYLERTDQGQHVLQAMAPIPGLKGPTHPTFIGTDKCKRCHRAAYEVWEKSAHAHAYKTLVNARNPSLRQYDPECIVCHTVGFGYQSGFVTEKKTPHLKNVGCESCHGPGSVHARNPRNEAWQLRMNPWHKPDNETPEQLKKRKTRIDRFCQTCHDVDNDVHWTHTGLKKKWPPIDHPFPWRTVE